MKQNGVSVDALRLSLFPYSLTHHAIAWYDCLQRNSVHSFDDMMRKFLSKYFPPSMVTKLRNKITKFELKPHESLFEAWERYKLSIDRFPNHNMLLVTQIDTFYNGLKLNHRGTINAAAGGTFIQKTPEECYELIKNMTAHHNHWDTSPIRDETSRNLLPRVSNVVTLAGPSVSPSSSSKEVDREPETIPDQKIPICYDDDEDYTIAITPKEPDNSLSMRDEHLDTIPATESNEFIKSSVENLVPNPSDFEGEHKCDVLACEDFTTFSNLFFDSHYDFSSSDDQSFSNEDNSKKIYSNPLFDEEIISIKLDPHHFNAESDLIESLLNHDSSIISSSLKIDYLLDEFVEFNSENSDTIIESFSPSPISVEDSNPLMEEIDLFLAFDGSISSGIDNDCSDSEGGNLFLERLLHDDPIPLPATLDFSYVVRVFLPFFTYPVTSSILLSSRSEDTIFDLDISNYHFSSLEPGVSHRSGTFMKFNVKRLKTEQKRVFSDSFRSRVLNIQDEDEVVNISRACHWKEHEITVPTESSIFPTDFVVVDYVVDPRGPLILGRPFLRTGHALIDVYGEELTLRVDDETITFKVGQTSKYSYNDAESINRIDVIDVACEDYVQEVLGFSDNSKSGNPTLISDPVISLSSPSIGPFKGGNFILEEIKACLINESIPPGIDDTNLDLEGDIRLLDELLNNDPSLSSLPPKELNVKEIKTIKSSINEPLELVLKELPSHLEYAYLEGTDKLIVIIAKDLKDDEKEALLNVKTQNGPLLGKSLTSRVLERLAGNEFYCFLDGLSAYIQILIDPQDQEKTTFTCPYGTFAYRRMPFGLRNAPGAFQRCMMEIFHDMIEKTMEVFMDDFSVFGDSFSSCLSHLDTTLQRCEDTNLVLN
uniref:Reverse transcriptase domain-containing protein n=1 Tax=Tanacetum cinerariifolium TaxID=118510 RepID=A0A699H2F7_TANCI|nr:reverse transcriptase domain-containing protein [Tanacetum cinerariifolium]